MSDQHHPHPLAALHRTFGDLAEGIGTSRPDTFLELEYHASPAVHGVKNATHNIVSAIQLLDKVLEQAQDQLPDNAGCIEDIREQVAGLLMENAIYVNIVAKTLDLHAQLHHESRFGETISEDDSDIAERLGAYHAIINGAHALSSMKVLDAQIRCIPADNDTLEQCREACLRVLLPSIELNAQKIGVDIRGVVGEIEQSMGGIPPGEIENYLGLHDLEDRHLFSEEHEVAMEKVVETKAAPVNEIQRRRQLADRIEQRDGNVTHVRFGG